MVIIISRIQPGKKWQQQNQTPYLSHTIIKMSKDDGSMSCNVNVASDSNSGIQVDANNIYIFVNIYNKLPKVFAHLPWLAYHLLNP